MRLDYTTLSQYPQPWRQSYALCPEVHRHALLTLDRCISVSGPRWVERNSADPSREHTAISATRREDAWIAWLLSNPYDDSRILDESRVMMTERCRQAL